jgi:hypothetical protein
MDLDVHIAISLNRDMVVSSGNTVPWLCYTKVVKATYLVEDVDS